jgi:hypothetical protein
MGDVRALALLQAVSTMNHKSEVSEFLLLTLVRNREGKEDCHKVCRRLAALHPGKVN